MWRRGGGVPKSQSFGVSDPITVQHRLTYQNLIGMCLLRQLQRVSNITARLAHQLMLSAQDVRYGMAG
jgi:hypothetical protein